MPDDGITQNITAKRGDPAFRQVPRGDPYADLGIMGAPASVLIQLLNHLLPISEPQDVNLPSEKTAPKRRPAEVPSAK